MDIQYKKWQPEPLQYTEPELIQDHEMFDAQEQTWVFDIEVFPDYFLVGMKSVESGKVLFFELYQESDFDRAKLLWVIEHYLLVGFNSQNYDLPILWAAALGKDNQSLYEMSAELISEKPTPKYKLEKKFGFKMGFNNHIDLLWVAPAAAQFLSLKHYGARMHSKIIQELDLNFDEDNLFHRDEIKKYNVNDLDLTIDLYRRLEQAIRLRQEVGVAYGEDLRSLSDAQIAEKVISTEIYATTGVMPEKPDKQSGDAFQFQNPDYIKFYTPELQKLHKEICSSLFVLDDQGKARILKDGKPVAATNIWLCNFDHSRYRLGIGGLHSSESQISHWSTENVCIVDRDVSSYYPNIIINQSLSPNHLGDDFLRVYTDLVTRRIEAKKSGDKTTADSLKITINGCFGKLGSKWSFLYAPELLIQVTLSGQLSLLMLIEMLHFGGISTVSANTDGIVIKVPKDKWDLYEKIVRDWEKITNFATDETKYRSIHSRDVNNYIAITEDGEIKAKGAYVNELSMKEPNREGLMKNPIGSICSRAAMLFLRDDVPIDQTIRKCSDVRQFVFSRRVKGGAVKDGVPIGKIVRWYVGASEFGSIFDGQSGNTVAESTGSVPIMQYNRMPLGIDYDWYIKRTRNMLVDMGVGVTKTEQLNLF